METRNVKITIQQAANWYSSNNDALKALALSAFSRDEIILYYIKVDFYDTDNSWYASRDNYIKDGSCNIRLGLGPGGPHDCSEEFPLLRRLKDAEKLKALIEILK
jgi:hypothetical protein